MDRVVRLGPNILCFVLRRRQIAERLHDPSRVVPRPPVEGRESGDLHALPQAAMMSDPYGDILRPECAILPGESAKLLLGLTPLGGGAQLLHELIQIPAQMIAI